PWADASAKKEGFDLGGFMHSLRRRYLLGLGLGFLLASLVALLVWLLVPVTHEAQVLIRVRRPENISSLGQTNQRMTGTEFELFKQTQVDLIRSPFVINMALRKEGISQKRIVQQKSWGGRRDSQEQYEWLARSLKIKAPENSEIVVLTLRDRDAKEVEDVLNAVQLSYIKEVVGEERVRQANTKKDLANRLRQIQDEILTKTKQKIDTAQRTGAQELGENNTRLSLLRDRLRSLGLDKDRAELEAHQLEGMIEEASFRFNNSRRYKPSATQVKMMLRKTNGEYAAIEQSLVELKLAATESGGLGGASAFQSQISQLQSQLQQIEAVNKKQVIELLKLERNEDPQDMQAQLALFQQQKRRVDARAAELDEQYNGLEATIANLNKANAELTVLEYEIISLAKLEEKLSQDIEGLELQISQNNNIHVIQPAQVPAGSSFITNVFQVVGAWILTLCCTLFGIAFWDFLSKRVNTTKDVMDEGELRVIGALPMLNGRRAGGLLPMSSGMRRSVEIGLSRAIDSIRTALYYSKRKDPIEVVLVTSALGQEGKTTVASQLAVSVARSGRRALLIDADVRNPQQHVVLGMPFHSGLCELLRGDVALEDVVRATPAEGLWHMSAGYRDAQSDQHMASPELKNIIDELRSRFDMIIIDTGPALTSPDSMLVGQYADVAIISVRRDVSRLPKVAEAAERLRGVGVEIMGAVVNGMNVDLRSSEMTSAAPAASRDPQIESAEPVAAATEAGGVGTSFDLDDDSADVS
ncbi:MAG: polysaccharide biosynthesis tyrosine autokinase, partial [Planctomycetales bacterium]|nr:polysaccharide biosynthesis tyrosine autokinase [Planctomycetales bacterium]